MAGGTNSTHSIWKGVQITIILYIESKISTRRQEDKQLSMPVYISLPQFLQYSKEVFGLSAESSKHLAFPQNHGVSLLQVSLLVKMTGKKLFL